MSGLRRPVSGAQTFVLVFGGVAFGAAQHWAGRLSAPQFLVVLAVLEFVVQPVSYLIHELGHAVAARSISTGRVSVIVGRGPYARFSLSRIDISFSFLPMRGVMFRGLCRYDPAGVSWRSRAFISLSGPAATLLELLLGLALARAVWPGADPFARNLIALSLIGLCMSLVVNLVPGTIKQGGVQKTLMANDGTKARAALRLHRQAAPLTPIGAPAAERPSAGDSPIARPAPTKPPLSLEFGKANVGRARTAAELDRERARTSIPPPGA